MRKGFAVGSFLVFLLMTFFGIMGMIAYANDPEAYDNYEKFYCEDTFISFCHLYLVLSMLFVLFFLYYTPFYLHRSCIL